MMAGVVPVSVAKMKPTAIRDLTRSLRQARADLIQTAKSLPDQDAFAMVYTIMMDAAENLQITVKELPEAMQGAHQFLKSNPDQIPNHAIYRKKKQNAKK
jgi:hypothetical protein